MVTVQFGTELNRKQKGMHREGSRHPSHRINNLRGGRAVGREMGRVDNTLRIIILVLAQVHCLFCNRDRS